MHLEQADGSGSGRCVIVVVGKMSTMDFMKLCKWQSTINTISVDNNNRVFNMLLFSTKHYSLGQRKRAALNTYYYILDQALSCPPDLH